jgi:hypothetical protein
VNNKYKLMLLMSMYASHASAIVIERDIEISLSNDQIYYGGYGSGVFWRPTFDLDPFTLSEVGDTVDIAVSFSNNKRVYVEAGSEEQESVFSLIGTPGNQKTFFDASWEFLDVSGDVYSSSYNMQSNSEGGGIAANFNQIDITDSNFSFGGVRYTFTIVDDPRFSGFPATFDEGAVAVQTQGSIAFISVPEPSPIYLMLLSIPLIYRQDKLKHNKTHQD